MRILHDAGKDRDKDFVRLVRTPRGFFTPATAPRAQTEPDLDKIVEDLLKDVDVPLFRRED